MDADSDEQTSLARLEELDRCFCGAVAGAGQERIGRLELETAITLTPLWRVRGRLAEGCGHLERALGSAPRSDPRLRVKGLWSLGVLEHLRGNFPRAASLAQESLEAADDASGVSDRALALGLLGRVTALHGDRRKAVPMLNEALALARQDEDQWCLVDNLLWSAEESLHENARDAEALYQECLAVGKASGDERAVAESLSGLGSAALLQADVNGARRLAQEAVATARRVGDRLCTGYALLLLGTLVHREGDRDAGERLVSESVEIGRQADCAPLLARALSSHARLAIEERRHDDATPLLEEAVRVARRIGLRRVLVRALLFLAPAVEAGGDASRAIDLLAEALAVARSSGDEEGETWVSFALGKASRDAGDLIRAGVMNQASLRARARREGLAAVAESLEGLAKLAAPRRPERAARLLGAADELRRQAPRSDTSAMCPVCADEAAELRHRLEDDGYRDAAEEGARMSVDEAIAFASRGAGPKSAHRVSVGPDALSTTERRVATLAAGGLTDAAIADKLLMSRWTVRAHMRHIFVKLGVSSRTELPAVLRAADAS